jgi:phosphoribosylformylglycinamidine synthase subunit PurL
LKVAHGLVRGVPPAIDLEAERALQELLVTLANERLIRSAHDCADGGLAVAVAECCFDTDEIGADIALEVHEVSPDPAVNRVAALFGESATRVVLSAAEGDVSQILMRATASGVPARVVGRTGGNLLRIGVNGNIAVDLLVGEAERAWRKAIERHFVKRVA